MSLPDDFQNPEFAGHLEVLEVLRRWDPIGVICDRNQNEYDSYSTGFVTLLDQGATADELVAAMRRLATGHIGLRSIDEDHTRTCAERLVVSWRSWRDGEADR